MSVSAFSFPNNRFHFSHHFFSYVLPTTCHLPDSSSSLCMPPSHPQTIVYTWRPQHLRSFRRCEPRFERIAYSTSKTRESCQHLKSLVASSSTSVLNYVCFHLLMLLASYSSARWCFSCTPGVCFLHWFMFLWEMNSVPRNGYLSLGWREMLGGR